MTLPKPPKAGLPGCGAARGGDKPLNSPKDRGPEQDPGNLKGESESIAEFLVWQVACEGRRPAGPTSCFQELFFDRAVSTGRNSHLQSSRASLPKNRASSGRIQALGVYLRSPVQFPITLAL